MPRFCFDITDKAKVNADHLEQDCRDSAEARREALMVLIDAVADRLGSERADHVAVVVSDAEHHVLLRAVIVIDADEARS